MSPNPNPEITPDLSEPPQGESEARDDLRDRIADVLRATFDEWIVAEWICCEPPKPGFAHKLCRKGHAARHMVASLLADDHEQHPPTSPILDAVLPVVEAELARARASCCEDGERTYDEMERHFTERAEQAERERDLAIAHDRQPYPTAWAYEQACKALEKHRTRADRAEAAVQRSRDALAAFDGRGVNNFDVPTPGEVLDAWRASLDQPEAAP